MATQLATITINVSLPEPLKRYVEAKDSSGVYSSVSAFVREAIREKLQRDLEAKAALTAKLLQGLDSGKPIPFTAHHFKNKKAALTARKGIRNGLADAAGHTQPARQAFAALRKKHKIRARKHA